MHNIYVYIAGPYTHGDPEGNVRLAIYTAEEIAKNGFVPFVPHLYHYWHEQSEHGYKYWMEMGAAWLDKCDCVFRIYGYSPGAATEVIHAHERRMPVFHSIERMVEYYKGEDNNGNTD
jgi:hypothetical protein